MSDVPLAFKVIDECCMTQLALLELEECQGRSGVFTRPSYHLRVTSGDHLPPST